MMPIFFLLLALVVGSIDAQSDNRCFLDGGGSTESFFIKESLPVGSLIGTLRILGEVGSDITLRLDGDSSPIDVEAGTKDVVLTRPLDKEGVSGAAAVSVEIVCERLGTSDPGFTIPVNIRVTDINDNAPVFAGAPYKLNISELTIVGSTIFDGIKATDKDQPGPFSTVEYTIAKGKYQSYVAFANPLEGKLVLTKHLDFESLKSFEVQIIARDQGSPPQESEATLKINVQDADDQNPAFFYEHYDALLPTGHTQGQKLIVEPQDLRAFDKDQGLGAPVFYAFTGHADEHKYFELNRNTGHIYIRADIPDTDFHQPVTMVIKATQFDNPDRYAVTTLTISRGGIFDSDLTFLQKEYQVKILENVPLNSVVTTLLTNRPSDRRVHFYVDEESLPGKEFSVNQKGDVILRKMLDFERQERYAFSVSVTDGRKNDTAHIAVILLNINDWDPRFKYPQYEFFVSQQDAFPGFVVGKLEVHDGDTGDKVTLDLKGPYARAFRINRRGELSVADMKHLNSSEAHVVVVAEDSGIPPRKTSVAVVVKFAGEVVSARAQDPLSAALDSSLILVVFGVVLMVFFVVILTMTVYICKNKKKHRRRRLGATIASSKAMSDYALHPNGEYGGRKTNSRIGGVDNPVFHRSDMALNAAGSRPGSSSSRRSSSETLSSDPSGSSPNQQQQQQQLHQQQLMQQQQQPPALNPLNPRSTSQRYMKAANGRPNGAPGITRVSPTLSTIVFVPPPPPTPSIHDNGLPDNRTPHGISVHPMPTGASNGAVPRLHNHSQHPLVCGSVNSVASSSLHGSEMSLQQVLRDNILTSSSRDLTRIQWPRNSIPRRVKKLSWEDEYELSRDRDISTLTDPNVSVTPLDPNRPGSGMFENQVGKALYF